MDDESIDLRIELAWSMASDRLNQQVATVDALHNRVGVVLSGAAIATGFLAGQALDTRHGLPVSAWIATVAAFLLIVLCAVLLWPVTWEGFDRNPEKVLEDVDQNPDRGRAEYLAELAGKAAAKAKTNHDKLSCRYRLLSGALVLLVVDFAGWIWTLAHN